VLARLLAYVGTLALLAIVGIDLWDQLPALEADGPSAKTGLSAGNRSHPAFAVGHFIYPKKQRLRRSSGIPKAAG
jgi:hypothetical protein